MNIKQSLQEKKITRKQFADYCGVSIRTICRYWAKDEDKIPKYFKLFANKILLDNKDKN